MDNTVVLNVNRPEYLEKISQNFKIHPVVALLGPRQCGKTTLARAYHAAQEADQHVTYFDLENPQHLAQLENPQLTLSPLSGLVVIDEVQRLPDLFTLLRVLVDRPDSNTRFLILGSASRDLIRQSSESLAGRIGYIEVSPFHVLEIEEMTRHWMQGGFPKAYLAPDASLANTWLQNYIRTYLESDIPNLGINIPAQTLRKFWNMLVHYHGNILNVAELARSIESSSATVKKYLDILLGTFMVRELKPWHANIAKRQVKQSKVYLRDSGLYHHFLGINGLQALQSHPKLGASWEGYALENVIKLGQFEPEECYFWATHQGAELDLLVQSPKQAVGFEFKYQDAPKMTKSLYSALESLEVEKIYVVYPGQRTYLLHEQVTVIPLTHIERQLSVDI